MPRRKSTNSTKTATRYDVIVNMSAAAADEGWIADRGGFRIRKILPSKTSLAS